VAVPSVSGEEEAVAQCVEERARAWGLPVVRDAASGGLLDIEPIRLSLENWVTTGAAKRNLIDRRQQVLTP